MIPTYTSLCSTSARQVSNGPVVRAPKASMPRTDTAKRLSVSQTSRRCSAKFLYVDEIKTVFADILSLGTIISRRSCSLRDLSRPTSAARNLVTPGDAGSWGGGQIVHAFEELW